MPAVAEAVRVMALVVEVLSSASSASLNSNQPRAIITSHQTLQQIFVLGIAGRELGILRNSLLRSKPSLRGDNGQRLWELDLQPLRSRSSSSAGLNSAPIRIGGATEGWLTGFSFSVRPHTCVGLIVQHPAY